MQTLTEINKLSMNDLSYTQLNNCLACGSSNLFSYLDLGKQPLANNYQKEPEELPKYPLQANYCTNCSHSQLSIAVNPSEMFKDYKYVSGTTQTLKDHFEQLIPLCVGHGKEVLDIGCNDGTLLEVFRRYGFRIYGVDPAENIAEITKDKGIEVLVDFWSAKTSFKMTRSFDVITACNVFAHNLNPLDFLKGCYRVLNPTGILLIEFPYSFETIKHTQFDQFYHEHINYFNAHSFITLAERAGFHIKDVALFPIHGGSIAFVLQKLFSPICEKARALVVKEEKEGLHQFHTYSDFQRRVDRSVSDLQIACQLSTQPPRKKVIGYGASAKSSVVLNYGKLPGIEYIVDDNPLKHHLYCPGSNIPILPPDVLATETEELKVIMFSWNFQKEIQKKIKELYPSLKVEFWNYVP